MRTRLEQDQLSQELQLFGRINRRLAYVAGIYYFRERGGEDWFPMHHIFTFPIIATGDAADAVNIRAEDNEIENEALALYGQLTWNPAFHGERLFFSLGWAAHGG